MSRLHRRAVLTGSPLSSRVSQWTQRGSVKLIQRGTITQTNVTSATATITSVVTANAIVRRLGGTSAGADSTKNISRIELTNATTVTAYTNTADAVNTVITGWEVAEDVAGIYKSLQRGTITCVAGAATTATITAVDTTKSEVDLLGQTFTVNLGSNAVNPVLLALTNATTVTATPGSNTSSSDMTVGYQVRERY